MKRTLVLVILLLASMHSIFSQKLELPRLFSNHMVLQRNASVRFWGWAEAGATVKVQLDNFEVSTKANASGEWECLYPAHAAGGPFEVVISTKESLSLSDVYFGDVWVAGGQSNMEWKIGMHIDNMEAELKDTNYPEIRFFKVANEIALEPQAKLKTGSWAVANTETAKEFSAVAWFFAKRNHLEKGVPVGVIDDNWGGTPAEAWTSTERVLAVEGYKESAAEMLDPSMNWAAEIAANDERNIRKWELVNDNHSFLKNGTQLASYDDSGWETVQLPTTEPLTDIVWLRKTFELNNTKAVSLFLGDLDQVGKIFINGQLIAEEIWSDKTTVIQVPPAALKKGKNTIAIRAINTWNNLVRVGRVGEMWVDEKGKRQSLEGDWKYSNTIEEAIPKVEFYNHKPGVLYNAMINPIVGYTIAGALWYQGESNVMLAQYYRELFGSMISDWRTKWRQGDFPFLFVQLANYQQRMPEPSDSKWAQLQEAQTQTLELPNTGMACIIDIGDADDIHPRNKQDVGARLWLTAKKVVFDDEVVYSGPMYLSHKVEDGKVIITYSNIGSGLSVKGDRLVGFALAGEDGKYRWADAQVAGDQVILSSNLVSNPKYVRYAWADNPACNLYNKEGLPAVPFRTDDF